MNYINKLISLSVLGFISLSSSAQSITASDTTLDSAEKKIRAKALREDADYKIIEASTKNKIHVTAKLFQKGSK